MIDKEIMARAICIYQGKNPDEPYMPSEIPKNVKATDALPVKWVAYELLCQKIIDALATNGRVIKGSEKVLSNAS